LVKGTTDTIEINIFLKIYISATVVYNIYQSI